MKRKKTKSKSFFKKASLCYVGAVVLLLAGIFCFSLVRGIMAQKLVAQGNYYFNGGAYNLEKAAKYYKAAAFVDREASYPHYQLARVLFVKADFNEARAEIDKALKLNPENKRAYYVRGLIDGYDGDWKSAVEDFRKFVEWAPKEWAGYNDLAWAYYESKDYQKAADVASKGLEVAPNNVWLLNGLGVSLQALGKGDEAKAVLSRAAELAQKITPVDWEKAYPGNDTQTAEWNLAQFRTDVNYNLSLASNPFFSGQGKFQAACSSTTINICSGGHCVPTSCDPDHQACFSNCTTDCDCGWGGTWPPAPTCFPASSCSEERFHSGISRLFGTCFSFPNPAHNDSHCCISQVSSCGLKRVFLDSDGIPPCPSNGIPTGSIQHPKNEQVSSGAVVFSWNYSDPEGDSQDGYEITGNCSLSGVHNSTVSSGYSSNNVTLGGFVGGDSCNWTLRVKDNREAWSNPDSATFTVVASPLPPCACGDLKFLCIGRLPTSAEMCNRGIPNPSPNNLNSEYYEVRWSCDPDASCGSSVSCSARGRKSCGWIETNP